MPDDIQQGLHAVPSPTAGYEPPEHHMHLLGRHYRQVEAGRKTIEARAAGTDTRDIRVGDTVVFHDRDTGRELDVTVQRITPYATFDALLRSEDTRRIDPDGPPGKLLTNLRDIYPRSAEALGVLAFSFGHRPARPGRPMPMTADELARIRLDPAEHDMWAVHDFATWQRLMAPRDFARLNAIEQARRGEGPTYLITHT